MFDEMLHEEQVEGWRELEEVSLFFLQFLNKVLSLSLLLSFCLSLYFICDSIQVTVLVLHYY